MSRRALMYRKRDKKTGLLIFLLFLAVIIGLFYTGYKIGAFTPIIDSIVTVDEHKPTAHVLTIVNIKSKDRKVLVPSGFENEDGTSELLSHIDVLWETSPRNDSFSGLLQVSVTSIVNKDGVDVSHIINVLLGEAITIQSNKPASLPVSITMNEPADQADYQLVSNQNITITFEFNVVKK